MHRHAANRAGPVPVAIVTVSDSRTPESDTSGGYLRDAIVAAGHHLAGYQLVADEPQAVLKVLDEFVQTARIVIFNGGTGISKRDRTYDTIAPLLEKTLVGFGELFRMLSYQEVGAAAMLSRATAGTYRDAVVITIPGSTNAVTLAWTQLIGPELSHLAWEVGR